MNELGVDLEQARETLRLVFGFNEFRGAQAEVVARVLGGRSTLAVMPTGAGKSLTYQLPAIMLPGTSIVVSPYRRLMSRMFATCSAPRPNIFNVGRPRSMSRKKEPR